MSVPNQVAVPSVQDGTAKVVVTCEITMDSALFIDESIKLKNNGVVISGADTIYAAWVDYTFTINDFSCYYDY